MGESTTIQISKETRDALKKMGGKGETYDYIISALIYEAGLVDKAREEILRLRAESPRVGDDPQ